MHGHTHLIKQRLAGVVPEMVYIDAGPATFIASDWPTACPRFAHISIEDSEPITGLDLRCVVGLFVQVSSDNKARLDALVAACRSELASRVIGVLVRRMGYGSELVEVTDTEGIASWQTS